MTDFVILYLATAIISLIVYVLIERQDNDVTLGTLISMFVIALTPVMNVIVMLLMLENKMPTLDFKKIIVKRKK